MAPTKKVVTWNTRQEITVAGTKGYRNATVNKTIRKQKEDTL